MDMYFVERVTGIEPVYPAWKAGVLAIVLYPLTWSHQFIVA